MTRETLVKAIQLDREITRIQDNMHQIDIAQSNVDATDPRFVMDGENWFSFTKEDLNLIFCDYQERLAELRLKFEEL